MCFNRTHHVSVLRHVRFPVFLLPAFLFLWRLVEHLPCAALCCGWCIPASTDTPSVFEISFQGGCDRVHVLLGQPAFPGTSKAGNRPKGSQSHMQRLTSSDPQIPDTEPGSSAGHFHIALLLIYCLERRILPTVCSQWPPMTRN